MANGIKVTTAGTAILTNRITQAGTAPKNIGWGTGTTTPTTADTALASEHQPTTAGGRTVGTESRTTITNANDTYTVTGTVTATDGVSGTPTAITEVGLFDNVTGGNMLFRAVFDVINVISGDSITFTLNVQLTVA